MPGRLDPQQFAIVRDALAELYATQSAVVVLVDDARLVRARIDLSGELLGVWHRVLVEAEKSGRTLALLDRALIDYPSNEVLQNARRVAAVPARAESAVVAPGTPPARRRTDQPRREAEPRRRAAAVPFVVGLLLAVWSIWARRHLGESWVPLASGALAAALACVTWALLRVSRAALRAAEVKVSETLSAIVVGLTTWVVIELVLR